jgi:hypothetical protein
MPLGGHSDGNPPAVHRRVGRKHSSGQRADHLVVWLHINPWLLSVSPRQTWRRAGPGNLRIFCSPNITARCGARLIRLRSFPQSRGHLTIDNALEADRRPPFPAQLPERSCAARLVWWCLPAPTRRTRALISRIRMSKGHGTGPNSGAPPAVLLRKGQGGRIHVFL